MSEQRSFLPALAEAARLAREASVPNAIGCRPEIAPEVVIYVTEMGFLVRGTKRVDGQEVVSARELDWIEVEAKPELLANSVTLVVDALAGKGSLF